MNAKRKGTRNEHRSIVILGAAGYACCRSAASLGACIENHIDQDALARLRMDEEQERLTLERVRRYIVAGAER